MNEDKQKLEDETIREVLPHIERILVEDKHGNMIFELHMDLDKNISMVKTNGGMRFAIKLSGVKYIWSLGDTLEMDHMFEDVDLHELLEEEANADQ